MSHLQCNSEFTSKDEYLFAFASGSLSFIVERLVGGRLVMINRAALLILQSTVSTHIYSLKSVYQGINRHENEYVILCQAAEFGDMLERVYLCFSMFYQLTTNWINLDVN